MKLYVIKAIAVIALSTATSMAMAQQAGDTRSIVTEQKAIRIDIQDKKNGWDAISEEKRAQVIKNQDRVLQLLEGKKSASELTNAEQIEVINALESINAVARNAEDERMVCRRERATGSNSKTRVCKTVAQMRLERESAVKTMTNSTLQNTQLSDELSSPF
jgi:hypothetical protein